MTLTDILKEYCDPVLRPAGVRRRGQRYELRSERADLSRLYFGKRPTVDGEIAFNMGIELWLDSGLAWGMWQASMEGRAYAPVSSDCFWWIGLRPPAEAAWSPMSDIWSYRDENGLEQFGAALTATLRDPGLPLLSMGQDRRSMLASFESVLVEFGLLGQSEERCRVLLLIDDGPSPELDAALAAVADDKPFLTWARTRRRS